MLSLIALMIFALGLVLLTQVGLIAFLSLLRVRRIMDVPQTATRHSQSEDYSAAINLLANATAPAITVRRPRTARQVWSGTAVRLPLRPAPADKVVFRIRPAESAGADHSVQPLLDYLRAELAARATG